MAPNRADFVAQVWIATKEALETQFWLRLIDESRLLGDTDLALLRAEAATVGRIVSAIARKARASDHRGPEP